MVRIIQATARDLPQVRSLFLEYMQWATGMVAETGERTIDAVPFVDHAMAEIQKFMPPDGRLFLACDDTGVIGCACMHTIRPCLGEVKRMYVRPEQRGSGTGRSLMQTLIADVRGAGYTTLRLDSGKFMTAAHALYRSLGF
jgi:GNAT superfamily N-acetyltransferase